ncbi:MAG: peptidoglycan recognition family protein [Planctomycetota bacterium]
MIANNVLRWDAARAVLLALLILPACSVVPRGPTRDRGPEPVLSVDYVLAPVDASTGYDTQGLERSSDPAAMLRCAWIELHRRRPQDAIDRAARVLYGTAAASPQAEALARYIRAEAYAAMGQPKNAVYDRERARELALDPRLLERLREGPEQPAPAMPTPVAAEAASVLPRATWRPAQPVSARLDPMGRIYRITVHHSAMLFRDLGPDTAAGQIRVIQRNHMTQPELRYGDIGYHFLIDPAGRIWQGRELRWQGAHARSVNNVGNIGICVLGNFIRGRDGQRPTSAEIGALRHLIGALSQQYGIPGNQVFSHRDFVNTECPGEYLETEVQRIASAIGSGRGHPVASAQAPRPVANAELP